MSTKLTESSTFDECVSNKISTIADEEPKVKPSQRTAIAYSVCRKKFGISKANILYLFEKSQLLNEESLEAVKATIEKEMKPADWVEFAAILKKEGKKHKEICKRVNKSETWIKKYINPILRKVTPSIKLVPASDTTRRLTPGLPIHTILKFTVTELKKETRTFGGWGSVEVLDSQEEVVSIEGLEAIMPTYMKRGAPIMFGHSNRHVGNVFKYLIKDKLVKDEYKPALWLEGRIHSDYKIDDMAWEALQYAYSAGLPVLSLGATPIGHPEVQCNDTACFKKYNEFQLYEFTITEQQKGSVGANPEATIEVALAKSKESKEVDSATKQQIGEHLSQLKKASKLPETDIDLVNMMLATCESCQDEYQNMIKQGKTEEEAKASLLKELVESLSETQKSEELEIKELDNPDADIIKSAPMAKEVADLAAALTKLDSRLDKIEQAVTKTTASIANTNAATADSKKQEDDEEEEEEEEEDNKKPPVTKADNDSKTPPAVTFSKDFDKQMDKHIEKYLQKKGFTKVAETPVPGTTTGREITEIQKGVANIPGQQSNMPTSEEMLDAMADWKNGGVTKLANKYGH